MFSNGKKAQKRNSDKDVLGKEFVLGGNGTASELETAHGIRGITSALISKKELKKGESLKERLVHINTTQNVRSEQARSKTTVLLGLSYQSFLGQGRRCALPDPRKKGHRGRLVALRKRRP